MEEISVTTKQEHEAAILEDLLAAKFRPAVWRTTEAAGEDVAHKRAALAGLTPATPPAPAIPLQSRRA